MAFSKSIIQSCELCQEDNRKWKCVDCEMCLCKKCKTFHSRVPVMAKHQIVTIATPIQDVQGKIITNDIILCNNHMTSLACMFCKTCNRLVCPECVSTSHTKHQFVPIDKALKDKLKIMRGTQISVHELLKVCESKKKEIENLMTQYFSLCEDSVTKIKRREIELKDAISQHSKILQDMVETERSMAKTIIFKVEKQVDEARKTLEDLKEKLEAVLTSGQGQVILDTTVTDPVLKFDSLPNKVKKFMPETETTIHVSELFGSFHDVTIPTINPEIEYEVIQTITTDLPSINKVIPLEEDSAWIFCYRSYKPVIREIAIQGNCIVTCNEITLDIYDMVLTANNEILVTKFNCSDIKLITKSMETQFYLTVAPLFPIGIHVTNNNLVLVGVIEPEAGHTASDQSQRAVITFDQDGKRKSVYQFDGNRKRLFNIPVRITTNNNQDIVVIDRTSHKTGRVVALDREGVLKWIYNGHPKINEAKKFDPFGITITAAGHIIISDRGNHVLHILSENGNALVSNFFGDMGVMYPWALNIDKAGNLWVGCGTCGEDTGAQLHIIKMRL